MLRSIALAFACCMLLGCGEARCKLHGSVSYRGKPLDCGVITFFPSNRQAYRADIQPDGSYTIELPVGSARIAVELPPPRPASRPNPGANNVAPPVPPPAAIALQIPPRYADPAESGLSVEVTGPDQQHNVDLP